MKSSLVRELHLPQRVGQALVDELDHCALQLLIGRCVKRCRPPGLIDFAIGSANERLRYYRIARLVSRQRGNALRDRREFASVDKYNSKDCVDEVMVERALDDAESADGLVGSSILDRNLCDHEVGIKPLRRDFRPQRIAEAAPTDRCRGNCGPAIGYGPYVIALAQQTPDLTDDEVVDTPGIDRELLGVIAE